jgi:NADPH:quinone reductase-like Zn-dependent oxidoreductase
VDPLVEPDGAALAEIAALVEAGELRVELERTFPLEEAAAAHELSESGRVSGKVVLLP